MFSDASTYELKRPCFLDNPVQHQRTFDYVSVLLATMIEHIITQLTLESASKYVLEYGCQLNLHCRSRSMALHRICGAITVEHTDSSPLSWLIWMNPGHNYILMFHFFRTIYSRGCEINSLRATKHTPSMTTSCKHQEFYCGHLLPWNETCPCHIIAFDMFLRQPDFTTQFSLSYYTSLTNYFSIWVNIGASSMKVKAM